MPMNRVACLFTLSAALLSGCSYLPRIPGVTPYRIDIQQGNYVTQEMVSQLKPGLTKEQVQNTLGTPLIMPVPVSMLKPAGSPVALKLVGRKYA